VSEILVTREGLERLSGELERLEGEWQSLGARIKRALEEGGAFPENGDYLDARHEQELLARRISLLERRLQDGELVEPEVDGELDIGERVRVRDLASGELLDYRIVGSGEGAPAAGDISYESPIGSALLGRRNGDVVAVEVPKGSVRLEVVQVDG
jgi:transcription elongation factor GreA